MIHWVIKLNFIHGYSTQNNENRNLYFFNKYIFIIRLETPEPISLCSVMAAPAYFLEGWSFRPHFRGSDMQIGVSPRLSLMVHLKRRNKKMYYFRCIGILVSIQRPRIKLNERFLPRPNTTIAQKLIPQRSNISKN